MISLALLRQYALSLPEVSEQDHFEKRSFRVRKKIFVTVDEEGTRACAKLSPLHQSVYCLIDKQLIYPVPGAWGKSGWTYIQLNSIHSELFLEILRRAYCQVAPRKLAALVSDSSDPDST